MYDILTVIVYKDITVASVIPMKATAENSVGEILYKLVNSVHGYNLSSPQGLAMFATVFVSVLKTTLRND